MSRKSKRIYARQGRKPKQTGPQIPGAPEPADLAPKELKVLEAVPQKVTPPTSARKESVGTVAAPSTYRYVIPDLKWLALIMGAMFVILVVLAYALK